MSCVFWPFFAAPLCILLWELLTGKSLDRAWRVSAYREIDPRTYWTDVALHAGIIAFGYGMMAYAWLKG